MSEGFRDDFKFYKRKDVFLNLSNVIDFNQVDNDQYCQQKNIKQIFRSESAEIREKLFGMKNLSEWKMYEVLSKPGLFVIKNPFKVSGQRYWIIRCLEYYTKKPNKLNLDTFNTINYNNDNDDDWWEYCKRNFGTEAGDDALRKLRWATFGYHHNWDTKEYSEYSKSVFPLDLKVLCSYISQILDFPDFNAEAAIINFYHFGSSISGHTDHSEINLKAPLYSFSFGQSAVFLIGGKTLDEGGLPILVESGDVIVMSGESRLFYHGVPRILQAKVQLWNQVEQLSSEICENECFLKEVQEKVFDARLWEPFDCYVKKSRINMNVRQVLLPGQKSLDH